MSKIQFSMAMAALMERDSVTTLCSLGEQLLRSFELTGFVGPFQRRQVACTAARAVNLLEEHEREQLERWLSEPPSFSYPDQESAV